MKNWKYHPSMIMDKYRFLDANINMISAECTYK